MTGLYAVRNIAINFIITLLLTSAASGSEKLESFILSFNKMSSTCDNIQIEKAYGDDGAVIKFTLHDLAELGNEEFKAGVELDRFEFKSSTKVIAKRFSTFDGKKVKEVYQLEKDKNGNLKSVSLKRFKRSFVRFTYPLGGIICRYQEPEIINEEI